LAEGKIKAPLQALTLAVNSLNNMPRDDLLGKSPNEIKPEDVGKILEHQLNTKRNKAEEYPDLSSRLKVGDTVRLAVLPNKAFTKSNEPKWSNDLFEIIKINDSSWPTPSYKIRSERSNVVMPGSFTFDQLLKVPDQKAQDS
jgi:hypothetical protein